MFTAIAYMLAGLLAVSAAIVIAAKLFFGMSWRDTLRRLVEFFS